MGDVSSGMASTVIQLYLKEILDSFLHSSTVVRSSAIKVVQLVLAQGLVHPVQVLSYNTTQIWFLNCLNCRYYFKQVRIKDGSTHFNIPMTAPTGFGPMEVDLQGEYLVCFKIWFLCHLCLMSLELSIV